MAPILPQPETLAGHWSLSEQGSSAACTLVLTLRPVGNWHVVEHDGRCLAALGVNGVTAWRSASDGIAFANADGRTVTFFARDRNGYCMRRDRGPLLLLKRDVA